TNEGNMVNSPAYRNDNGMTPSHAAMGQDKTEEPSASSYTHTMMESKSRAYVEVNRERPGRLLEEEEMETKGASVLVPIDSQRIAANLVPKEHDKDLFLENTRSEGYFPNQKQESMDGLYTPRLLSITSAGMSYSLCNEYVYNTYVFFYFIKKGVMRMDTDLNNIDDTEPNSVKRDPPLDPSGHKPTDAKSMTLVGDITSFSVLDHNVQSTSAIVEKEGPQLSVDSPSEPNKARNFPKHNTLPLMHTISDIPGDSVQPD
ncbi:hypothetical protein RFI_07287, partial [Reticulomyxa filosa]